MKLIPALKIFSVLLLIGVAVTLVLQNTEVVDTKFLFATISMPRAMLLALVFVLGVFSGILMTLLMLRRKRKQA